MFPRIVAMSHNVSLVCDAAPSLTKARGRCGDEARRSAEEPEAPSEAPMHIRAVIRSCAILRCRHMRWINQAGLE
jgi:hypothetical protein